MTPLSRLHSDLLWWRSAMGSCCVAVGILVLSPAASAADDMSGAAAAICAKLAGDASPQVDALDHDAVKAFYGARDCLPLWVDDQGPTRAASRAIDEIGHAEEWGLDRSDFKLEALKKPKTNGRWSTDETATADLELTGSVLRYAHQAQGGRIPVPDKQLSSYLDRQPSVTSAADVLTQISQDPDPGQLLRSFQPSQDQFLKLKVLLATLRGTAESTDKPRIAMRGPQLQEGSKDPEVAILKQQLQVASKAGDEQLFDDTLSQAVRKFQESNGLTRDGIVGSMTRAALSGDDDTPVADKADRITAVIANMEEWRWMPRSLGATNVFVNVPAFKIVLTDKNEPVFEERVVVGTPSTQTPIFSKNMTTIVLRPPWILPDSIKLSALLSGRSIESQGYIVMRNGHTVESSRVNWAKADLKEYSIYQPSGDDNALGLVKLLFPNKHSVYLHDTPSKGLFNEPVRLFSHGCMRVRNPQELAQKIFDIDRGANAPDVKRLVRKGPLDNEFTLNTPIPVHVGYFTVWVSDDGQPTYYNDYYGHQQRITLALAGKWDQIDVGRDHLAALDTSLLKEVKIGSDKDSKKTDDDSDSDTSSGVQYSRYNDTVGDMIRKSLGF